MATENRIITFTDAEVLEALATYCVKTGCLGNKAKISSPLVTNDGEVRFSFDPIPAGARITLHEGEVLSVMILYCNDQGLPILRRAQKSIQVSRDSFSLHLDTPRL